MSSSNLIELIKQRRTQYVLGKDLPISNEKIQELVTEAIQQVPSSFNSQTNRVVILFGAEHDKFWNIVSDTLKAIVPEAQWSMTEGRINGFKAGAGSILFFDDQDAVADAQSKFAMFADKLPGWAAQSNGMLQYTIWLALAAENVGSNLQHYNPIVDDKVIATWDLPKTWTLNAQLVFGSKKGEAGPRESKPVEEKIKVFGA